jgi:hypothetical protein
VREVWLSRLTSVASTIAAVGPDDDPDATTYRHADLPTSGPLSQRATGRVLPDADAGGDRVCRRNDLPVAPVAAAFAVRFSRRDAGRGLPDQTNWEAACSQHYCSPASLLRR